MSNAPLIELRRWLSEAQQAGAPHPWAATFVTVGEAAAPSARTVTLKRVDADGLVFTSALLTRKVAELRANPAVAVAFHWPTLGRQVLVQGSASEGERALAEELFAERPREHQLQALASRQGAEIRSLESIRERLVALRAECEGQPVPCPEDWGVVHVAPSAIEFWQEARDRLHERVEYRRSGSSWTVRLLAP